jgi:hypothetical protein
MLGGGSIRFSAALHDKGSGLHGLSPCLLAPLSDRNDVALGRMNERIDQMCEPVQSIGFLVTVMVAAMLLPSVSMIIVAPTAIGGIDASLEAETAEVAAEGRPSACRRWP